MVSNTWIGGKEGKENATMKEDLYNESNDVTTEEDSLDFCANVINQNFSYDDTDSDFYEQQIDQVSEEETEEVDNSISLDEDEKKLERKLNEQRFMSTASMIKFFKYESEIYEFSRSTFTFVNEKDSSIYKGKVLKQMPGNNSPSFIFLIEQKKEDGTVEKKMKKFSVDDISVFI